MEEAFKMVMVLPRRMTQRFANTKIVDMPDFRCPPPVGVLRVKAEDHTQSYNIQHTYYTIYDVMMYHMQYNTIYYRIYSVTQYDMTNKIYL